MASAFVLVEENSNIPNIPIDRLVEDIRQVCLEANLHLIDGIQDVDSEQNMKHCALGISRPNQEDSDNSLTIDMIRVDCTMNLPYINTENWNGERMGRYTLTHLLLMRFIKMKKSR